MPTSIADLSAYAFVKSRDIEHTGVLIAVLCARLFVIVGYDPTMLVTVSSPAAIFWPPKGHQSYSRKCTKLEKLWKHDDMFGKAETRVELPTKTCFCRSDVEGQKGKAMCVL